MSFLLAGFYIHYGKDICSKQLEKPVLLRFSGQTLRSRSQGQGTGGFHWSDIDPNYMDWSVDQYREGMKSPRVQQQFSNDIQALEWADTCVLILPCGRSAHTEVGWFAGKGKRTIVYIPEMEELYALYLENHDKVSDFWPQVNHAREPYPSVVSYVDAVEVALCFGWIGSTQKRIDEGRPIQHFTLRSKHSNWCWNNIERYSRLIDLDEMTPAGLAVIPNFNPDNFVFKQWVIDGLMADSIVWKNFNSFPGAYQCIKVDRIQHYNSTKRPHYAMQLLQMLIDDTRKGKMQPGWDAVGKLLGY